MKEQTGNASREVEILRKNQMEIPEVKNSITVISPTAQWTWPRKERVNLNTDQQRFSKPKCKE